MPIIVRRYDEPFSLAKDLSSRGAALVSVDGIRSAGQAAGRRAHGVACPDISLAGAARSAGRD